MHYSSYFYIPDLTEVIWRQIGEDLFEGTEVLLQLLEALQCV